MQVPSLNSNNRTSNCQCSLFSKKYPIIRIFCIFRWLARPINPDSWSSMYIHNRCSVQLIGGSVRSASNLYRYPTDGMPKIKRLSVFSFASTQIFQEEKCIAQNNETAGRTARNGTMYRRKKERWSILKSHNTIFSDSLGMNTSTMMVNTQAMEHARKEVVRV